MVIRVTKSLSPTSPSSNQSFTSKHALILCVPLFALLNIISSSKTTQQIIRAAPTFLTFAAVLLPKPDDVPTAAASLPPLQELAETSHYSCPPGLIRVNDTHLPHNITHPGRKIPRIVHITAKSRCVTPSVLRHLKQWQFPGHSFYFHDDEAVDGLLYSNHTGTPHEIVPNLTQVLSCVTTGATKSDIWRYLILWHYGGIYSDIDNSATRFNGSTISPDDDSFFVVESLGIMSQYFLASSPKHPLMKHALNFGIPGLQNTVNVMVNNPAHKTGPGAIKNGFINFQKAAGISTDGYIPAGIYEGAEEPSSERRYCTVVGKKYLPQEYINRSGLSPSKKQKKKTEISII
jgi:hypothetical protein